MRRWDWELFKIGADKALARWWWLYLLIGFSLPFMFLSVGIKPPPRSVDDCVEVSIRADMC